MTAAGVLLDSRSSDFDSRRTGARCRKSSHWSATEPLLALGHGNGDLVPDKRQPLGVGQHMDSQSVGLQDVVGSGNTTHIIQYNKSIYHLITSVGLDIIERSFAFASSPANMDISDVVVNSNSGPNTDLILARASVE